MSALVPHSEQVRAALAFIVEKKGRGRVDLTALCDEAGMRFNLSPRDVQALRHALARSSSDPAAEDDETGAPPAC